MSAQPDGWFNNDDRSVSSFDVYLFGHGMNFKAAVFDLMQISGKQQLASKNLYGSWYTRWFDFDNDDVQRIITNYRNAQLPLDVLILDMNWHTKDSWTGYTWDRALYPIPSDTVAFAHSQGLKIGANLHDAVGFGFWEEKYAVMAAAMGEDPSTNNTVIFSPLNRTYMHTMEDQVLAQLGFDIWWIDWQQGGNYGGCDGERMNPTFITDHVRSTDNIRRGVNQRDNILARWGGVGSQRYPVGFSGDVTDLSWQCFAYQPYFVATAANVGYGLISNDLVGPSDDHELHVRWMQFGAYSPILRIHDRGMSSGGCWGSGSCAVVDMWYLPFEYLDAIRIAMTERSALQPYIYTAMRRTYDTGLTMIRPLYYEWPTESNAYLMTPSGNAQYMFGDDVMVAPITTQSQQTSLLVQQKMWIPPGTWYDDIFGELVTGGTFLTRDYTLYDTPRFVRAGAVIPRLANPASVGVAGSAYAELDWMIYPGASSGVGFLYEDDGNSHDYASGFYAFTTASYTVSGTTITVTVHPANGTYSNQLSTRNVRVILVGVLPLSSASVNGVSIPAVRFGPYGALSYTYDGKNGAVYIDLGPQSTASTLTVTATLVQQDSNPSLTSRMKVYSFRTRLAKETTDNYQQTPFETVPGPGSVKQAAARAGYVGAVAATSPSSVPALLGAPYLSIINNAIAELNGVPGPTPLPTYNDVMLVQLYDFSRGDMLLCGSDLCIATNGEYQVLWVEGFQPSPSSSDRATFYDYFNGQTGDNYGTTSSTPPQSGYSAAIFANGYVFQNSAPDRNCLQVYFLASENDYFTTGTPQGHQWATDHGYTQVSSQCQGYAGANEDSTTGAARVSKEAAEQYVADVRRRHRQADAQAIVTPPRTKNQNANHPRAGKTGSRQPVHKFRGGRQSFGDNNDPVQIALALFESMTD
jgi:hypothetical protein